MLLSVAIILVVIGGICGNKKEYELQFSYSGNDVFYSKPDGGCIKGSSPSDNPPNFCKVQPDAEKQKPIVAAFEKLGYNPADITKMLKPRNQEEDNLSFHYVGSDVFYTKPKTGCYKGSAPAVDPPKTCKVQPGADKQEDIVKELGALGYDANDIKKALKPRP